MQPTRAQAELLTADDYRATPDGTRYQLVEGDLYLISPAPNRFHQDIVLNIATMLRAFLRNNPIGKVYVSPIDVYLDDHNVVQPDVVFVSNARFDILADDGLHGAPDLAVEVISPSNAQLDKTAKRRVYTRHGVKELWLVDPTLRQIHLYEFARDPAKAVRLVEDDETFQSALLPGLTVNAVEVFKR
ncbi:MAG: Uma2 family endonuclease [Opitutaceae bacterium]